MLHQHQILAPLQGFNILCLLNPTILNHLLSATILESSKCLYLFELLLKNQFIISFKPDLHHHIVLASMLVKERMFLDAEHVIYYVSIHKISSYPFPVVATRIRDFHDEPRVISKMFNLLLLVYSYNGFFDRASETFDYMKDNGIKISERTCTMHLHALQKSGQLELCLDFFYRMIESGIEISVYSLTVAIDGMCRAVETKRCREFVIEIVDKPNIVTLNTIINFCRKRWNFQELDMVLLLMENEGVDFNAHIYKILIDGFTSYGRFEEAERLILEMHQKARQVDTHLYNLIPTCHC